MFLCVSWKDCQAKNLSGKNLVLYLYCNNIMCQNSCDTSIELNAEGFTAICGLRKAFICSLIVSKTCILQE